LGSHETESPIDSGRQTPPPGQWIAGAKALAAFQADHYATGQSGKNQHHGSKAMTLKDVTSVCQQGAKHGLSHSFMFRPLGERYAVARVILFHESGESIFSEIGFSTDFKGARSQEQALGSAKTYYHKYMLSGLYGLANDDDDDGESAVRPNTAQAAKPVAKPVTTPKQQSAPPVPSPAQVEKAMNAVVNDGVEVEDPNAPITAEAKEMSLRILKSDPKAKAAFLAEFYPSKSKLIASDINTMAHAKFLDEHELETRLVH
jgi:hypothetical protein